MFKTFASALLAASVFADLSADLSLASTARGKGDGTGNENAVYCDLFYNSTEKVRMDLYTYMKNDNDKLEWHGETKLYMDGASAFPGSV